MRVAGNMRLSKILQAINWKYAIGEMLLIVFSISIALAANAWYSNRQNRKESIEILELILQSLERDREEIVGSSDFFQQKAKDLTTLLEHVRSKQPYSESLDYLFGRIGTFSFAYIDAAPYEVLRARSLDLAYNLDLQIALNDFYDQERNVLVLRDQITREQTLSYTRDYGLINFSSFAVGVGATPNNYPVLIEDPLFLAHIGYQISISNLWLRDYGSALDKIDTLISDIRVELADQ
jgi:hypothetical protein